MQTLQYYLLVLWIVGMVLALGWFCRIFVTSKETNEFEHRLLLWLCLVLTSVLIVLLCIGTPGAKTYLPWMFLPLVPATITQLIRANWEALTKNSDP